MPPPHTHAPCCFQHNDDVKEAAACAPCELAVPIALRLGLDVSKQLAAVQGDLDLFGKKIGDAGIIALCAHLTTSTTITSVDLYNNNLTDAVAESLAAVAGSNANIVKIVLGGNQISDEACERVAAACEVRHTQTYCAFCRRNSQVSIFRIA